MNELEPLRSGRKEDCPSDLTLTQFDSGSLDREARDEVAAHIGGCDRCRSWLDDARASFEAVDLQARDQLLDRMVAARAESRGRRAPWGWGTGLVAAAAAALFFVARPDPSPPDILTKGGGLQLSVFRERAGRVSRVMSGDAFEAKDRLRFEIDLPEAGHVLVFGVEASGATYRAFPNDRDSSVAFPSGQSQLLPGAIELDASSGQESLHLVFCPHAFTVADVSSGTSLRAPTGCTSTVFELDKRGR